MGRRRGQGPAISLFSFQDIITSVTGILILITLLLALELLDRDAQRTSPSPDHLASELRAAMDEATRERQSLLERTNAGAEALRQVVGVSPAALRRDAEQTQQLAGQTEAKVQDLRRQLEEVERRQTRVEAERFDRRGQREELDAIKAEMADLERKAEADRLGDRIYFSSGREQGQDGWLVEVAGGRIAVAPLGRESRPVVFDRANPTLLGIGLADAAVDDFLDWSRRQGASYLLVLVRPSGVARFNPIESALRSAGQSFGFDLIGESQQVLDPERGVFRE